MVTWIDKEPEFDNWPKGFAYFTDDKTIRYDRNHVVVIQPENNPNLEKELRPKPELARDIYFECMKEMYPAELGDLKLLDSEDIIIKEKG